MTASATIPCDVVWLAQPAMRIESQHARAWF